MIVRKILIATGAAALMSTPAWALPGQTPSNQGTERAPATTPVGPPSTVPNNTENPGSSNRNPGQGTAQVASHGKGRGPTGPTGPSGPTGTTGPTGHHGHSHKCMPHKVGYVAGGTLVSQKLEKNADGTYSGELEVEVTHTNHHAAADKGKTVTYTLSKARVTFGLADTNSDGSVGLDDLAKGDRTHVIGKITALARKCAQGEFKATTTINHVVFHAPATSAGKS
jgi:hypothetical protein